MIHKTALLHCGVERAFSLFTEHAGEWWPPTRRHTGDAQSTILIEQAGRFFERSREGKEVELGRVKVWEPPRKLVLDWYPGTDCDHPTEVTVTFVPEGEKTRIRIDHGAQPVSEEQYKQRNAAFDRSWDLVLEALSSVTN
jgi:uncharacterized protein YndB with AHSA1/START domain